MLGGSPPARALALKKNGEPSEVGQDSDGSSRCWSTDCFRADRRERPATSCALLGRPPLLLYAKPDAVGRPRDAEDEEEDVGKAERLEVLETQDDGEEGDHQEECF